MGQGDVLETLDDVQARAFQQALLKDLVALEYLCDTGALEDGVRRVGAEQEMFLVDRLLRPASVGPEALAAVNDSRLTSEIGRFNLEANISPRLFSGRCLREMEDETQELIGLARRAAAPFGADILLAGILPTIRQSDLTASNLTPKPRYFELDRIMKRMRGDQYHLLIRGLDELQMTHDNVMLEACCTSFQVHYQASPQRFSRLYNAAQLLAAPVLAAATNSPVLFGHRLWHETRIAVFQHSVDERSSSRVARDYPTRVGFGNRWVERSAIEIFREDIARFPVIMTAQVEEDPLEVLHRGGIPQLAALRLHVSTIWRWNRVCYGVLDGRPHLRIETRFLPAGPTVLDETANAAFHFGLMASLDEEYGPVDQKFSFEDVKQNFLAAARHGLDAQFVWLGDARVPARTLILKHLLPLARAGLKTAAIAAEDIERYLGTIEERVRRDQTGSQWVLRSLAGLSGESTRESQHRRITEAMLANQQSERPVHTWELPPTDAGVKPEQTVQDIMSTDLYTVQPNATLQLASSIMDWRSIGHMLVEDETGRFCGLVSDHDLLRALAGGKSSKCAMSTPVREIMNASPVTASPDTPLAAALQQMRDARSDCLPIVSGVRLVGIITSHDVLTALAKTLDVGVSPAAGSPGSNHPQAKAATQG